MSEDYTFERDFHRDIHEHEVFISFNNDSGAEAFMEWWWDKGEKAFNKWCDS